MREVSLSDMMDEAQNYNEPEPARRFSPGFTFHKTSCGSELFTLGIWKWGWEVSFRHWPNRNIWITFDWWRWE